MPRLSYVDPATLDDPELVAIIEHAAAVGTPRPESQAVRAQVPAVLRTFTEAWRATFEAGVLDRHVKELCRLYVSRSVECEYCGDQRSLDGGQAVVGEAEVDELLRYARSERFDDREKAALAYTEAIAWNPALADDALWARLHHHFSEPELVELGFFVGLTLGQQRWIRTLDLGHGEVLPGSTAGLSSAAGTRVLRTTPAAAGGGPSPAGPVRD